MITLVFLIIMSTLIYLIIQTSQQREIGVEAFYNSEKLSENSVVLELFNNFNCNYDYNVNSEYIKILCITLNKLDIPLETKESIVN